MPTGRYSDHDVEHYDRPRRRTRPRTKERPIRENNRVVGFRLFGAPVGEHRMPDLNDPTKFKAIEPKFLTGERPSGSGRRDGFLRALRRRTRARASAPRRSRR